MAYASNQDDGNVVEIDTQILNAFMEVDPVFNPTVMDVDVEPWDPYFTVDSFRSLTNPHAYYKIEKVHVDFVWLDENNNKLYYFLHDKDGEKMAAEVPPNLVAAYKDKTFAQTFVSIHNFQVVYSDPTGYPRYQTYSFLRRDWFVAINSDTVITKNLFAEETRFQMHSWLPSIRGAEIKFVAFHTLRKVPTRIARVIQEQGTIYLTRVKLVHTESMNLLVDTELTGIEFDPVLLQAEAFMKMTI
ncbi:hypothetical protein Tco_0011121 [Tanacetum coccineum]